MRHLRLLGAEAIGTAILMLGGPGTAVLAGDALDGAAVLGISLGFGFSLLVIAYTVGPVSGGHVNPAVTLALWAMKKVDSSKVPAYIVGQLIGAAAGGGLILGMRHAQADEFDAVPTNFATNLWGHDNGFANFGGMFIAEVVLTALLVLAVLATTKASFPKAATGLSVGIALTVIHLISIPVDNTSVNPARSFGMAIYAGGDAMEQLWAFVLIPLLGAFVGVLLWLMIDDARLEDTALADSPLVGLRDAVDGALDDGASTETT